MNAYAQRWLLEGDELSGMPPRIPLWATIAAR